MHDPPTRTRGVGTLVGFLALGTSFAVFAGGCSSGHPRRSEVKEFAKLILFDEQFIRDLWLARAEEASDRSSNQMEWSIPPMESLNIRLATESDAIAESASPSIKGAVARTEYVDRGSGQRVRLTVLNA